MSPTDQSTRQKGASGEQFVCDKLVHRGFKILDRNVYEKFAELDIVAMDGDTLCFIEVRTRFDDSLGHPAETVTVSKQRSIRRAAESYLMKRKIQPCPMRFDVATVVWSRSQYEYFENAF